MNAPNTPPDPQPYLEPSSSRHWVNAPRVILSCAGGVVILLLIFLPHAAAPAYLAAFMLFATLPLGACALLMLHMAVGTSWGDAIRPELERAAGATPLLVVFILPIACTRAFLYPWAHAGPHHPYFDPRLIALRTIVFLALWGAAGPWLARASRRTLLGARAAPAPRAVACVGLVLYVLSVTFAFTDWISSLDPSWHSSMFGLIVVCTQGLSAMAFAVAVSCRSHRRREPPTPAALRDLGNLLLAFAILHAYVSFSQFFIIWNSDVPGRTQWYLPRSRGLWLGAVSACAILQFAIPLGAMLFGRLKASPSILRMLGVIILFGSFLEAAWITLPSTSGGPLARLLYPLFCTCLGLLFLPFLLPRPAQA